MQTRRKAKGTNNDDSYTLPATSLSNYPHHSHLSCIEMGKIADIKKGTTKEEIINDFERLRGNSFNGPTEKALMPLLT